MDRDTEVIEALVAAEGSLPELVAAARAVSRFDVPVRAQVTANAVLSVLDRWESGEISAETVQAWAEAVGEDWSQDVEADPPQEYEISRALLSLSRPLLDGPLTTTMAAQIRAELGASVELSATESSPPSAVHWVIPIPDGGSLGRAGDRWFAQDRRGRAIAIEGRGLVAGLVLLERSPAEVLESLKAAGDPLGSVETPELVLALPITELVEYTAFSDYWAGRALSWLELAEPSARFLAGLKAIEAGPRISQQTRHRALRLRVLIEGRTHTRRPTE